jgi:cell division protein FtsW
MIRARDTDKILILAILLLVGVGILMVYSTSYIVAMERFGDEYFFFKKHLFFSVIGFFCFLVTMYLPYKSYKRFAYPILLAAIILLFLVFVEGIGVKINGASRWINLGPIRFQPSELAKVAVVIFLAYSLEAKGDKIKTFSLGLLPHVLIPALPVILIYMEPDLGTTLVMSAVIFIMMYIAGVRLKHLLSIILPALLVLYLMITTVGYRMERILTFLNPWRDPTGSGFQMVHSLMAIGSGGLYGVGLGEGRQKLFYLPEAHTDFIFSVIGEELGIIGVGLLIFLYALFLICGLKAALKSVDLFGTYLAVGPRSLVILQAIVNMGVVMGLLPAKGLPLPFVSYGGTSLVVNMAIAGMLLNIYKNGCEA